MPIKGSGVCPPPRFLEESFTPMPSSWLALLIFLLSHRESQRHIMRSYMDTSVWLSAAILFSYLSQCSRLFDGTGGPVGFHCVASSCSVFWIAGDGTQGHACAKQVLYH